jgi:uncharacterized protein
MRIDRGLRPRQWAIPARTALLAAAAALAAPGGAHALDCASAKAPAEKVICSDKGLQKLLQERQQAYKAARARSTAAEKKALADDNRRWLKDYQASCGIDPKGGAPTIDRGIVRCVADAFKARIARLRAHSPKAAPAAAESATPAADEPETGGIGGAPGQSPAATAGGAAGAPKRVHFAFTFACRTPAKLKRVLRALARNDLAYPLNQPDCLPLVKGRAAQLIARDGKIAKIRLCSPDAGCIEVYTDAASILGKAEKPEKSAGK